MISFTCDYTQGAHPEILRRLAETNLQQEEGYGMDSFSEQARQKIKAATGCSDADVFFLVGGTQTNATVIDALLQRHQGVVAVETGHIAVHEAGAIEATGHKVITLPAHEGRMWACDLTAYLRAFYDDPTWPHMVVPGMVYLSFPTEYGTLYSRQQLADIHNICRQYNLPLFIDGARLGYALASPMADINLPGLASLCDVFYIGGTKVGALCGEAVVFPRGNAPKHFFTLIKQHGALLAKGRLLGVQFDTLFTHDLYLDISRHAIQMAMRLKNAFTARGIELFIDSPTNQQFPILTTAQAEAIGRQVAFEVWQPLPGGRLVTRFATSWATPPEHIDILEHLLDEAGA